MIRQSTKGRPIRSAPWVVRSSLQWDLRGVFSLLVFFSLLASPCVDVTLVHAGDPAPGQQRSSAQGSFVVKQLSNLRYCDYESGDSGSAGYCDVYLPQRPVGSDSDADRRLPVVLVVHGGGWVTGNKWTMDRHARELAKRGFAAVSINYRLAPACKFPDQVDDIRSALVWIAANAKKYSFDTQRVGLYGYSAGGHLVSLVATLADEPWDKVRQTTSWRQDDPRWSELPAVRAVCIGGPPTDFRQLPPDNTALAFFLGGTRREVPDVYSAASPICFTSPQDPPFEIIHGEADLIVPVSNAKDFYSALLQANVQASLHTLPNQGHLLAFINPKLTDWMLVFFEDHLLNRGQ